MHLILLQREDAMCYWSWSNSEEEDHPRLSHTRGDLELLSMSCFWAIHRKCTLNRKSRQRRKQDICGCFFPLVLKDTNTHLLQIPVLLRVCGYACVCVCMRMHMFVCVCVCVRTCLCVFDSTETGGRRGQTVTKSKRCRKLTTCGHSSSFGGLSDSDQLLGKGALLCRHHHQLKHFSKNLLVILEPDL